MIRNIFFFSAFSLVTVLASAQPVATPQPVAVHQPVATPADLRMATDQIMEQVGVGHLEAGLKLLKPLTAIPEAEFDAMMGQALQQVPPLTLRFGATSGYEFIREDRVGENLIRLTYIHRFEKYAMRWIFYAYHGKNGWAINMFNFDDKIAQLFS